MTVEFYRQMLQAIRQRPVVLATVTQVRGSVPREVGAKLLIDEQGPIVGTIGGGAGEARVMHQAQRVLETGEKQFVEIDLSGSFDRPREGVCGGWMQVWLERWSGVAAIALVEQILACLKAGRPITLVTPLDQQWTPYLDSSCSVANSTMRSSSPVGVIAPILDRSPTTTGLIELLQPPPTLLIVGAGHVAVALAQVAHLAGFQIAVQDDRPEFACLERFPLESIVLPLPIAAALQEFSLPAHLYVALVTRGFQADLDALECLLTQSSDCFRYIGMIGSKKRVRTVFQALQQRGISPTLLQQIHAPIGLSIGALTPEEIAVSICAELIQVRRGGTGQSLSARRRPIAQPTQLSAPETIPDAQRYQQFAQ